MSKMLKLTIDGKPVEVPEGLNIIEAAELAGTHIPNLCYVKGMKGVGACRLCLVEIEGQKAPMIACNTRIKDGMNITTKTPAIEETRKFVIDLILSMHPLDCMTCTKAGVCSLQNYAYDLGIKESSFTRKKFGYPTDARNPFIARDPDYCILCGRCVRTCKEQGTSVLEFMGRGVGSKVTTATDNPLEESGCTFCGSCIDACPVNAILESDRSRKGREWDYEQKDSVCLMCGNGCDITVSTKGGRIMKVNSVGHNGSSDNYICAYGRYGYDCIEADTRLTSPMKRAGGKLKETTWEDALKLAGEALKNAGKDAGFVSTASITNEEAIALKAIVKAAGTKNAATTLSLYAEEEVIKTSASGDLDSADVIIVIGLAPSQWKRVLPALDSALRRRVQRGAKLITINSERPAIADAATISLEGDEPEIAKSLIKDLIKKGLKADSTLAGLVANAAEPSQDIMKAADLVISGQEVLILSSPGLFGAASNIALMKGKAIAVPLESNARGVAAIGIGNSYSEIVSGGLKALYVMGEIPAKDRPRADFLIVATSHMNGLAKEADVVLPAATFFESAGSMVDYLGELKNLPQVISPQGGSKTHLEILSALAESMGHKLKKITGSDVKKAIKTSAKATVRSFDKKSFEVSPEEMVESINASVINGTRLLWLKERAAVA
jgi:NADH dehydrogenase/NADH:ubiquinone oxidoreductase subunit G